MRLKFISFATQRRYRQGHGKRSPLIRLRHLLPQQETAGGEGLSMLKKRELLPCNPAWFLRTCLQKTASRSPALMLGNTLTSRALLPQRFSAGGEGACPERAKRVEGWQSRMRGTVLPAPWRLVKRARASRQRNTLLEGSSALMLGNTLTSRVLLPQRFSAGGEGAVYRPGT